jgi:hypothetical protein
MGFLDSIAGGLIFKREAIYWLMAYATRHF